MFRLRRKQVFKLNKYTLIFIPATINENNFLLNKIKYPIIMLETFLTRNFIEISSTQN